MSLDEEYGALRPPQKVDSWEVSREPLSKSTLCSDIGKRLTEICVASKSQLFRHSARTITYIWAMDQDGKIHIAVEELAEMPDGTVVEGYPRRRNFPVHPAEEKKLGHPTLLCGSEARTAGELFLDEDGDDLKWFVNVSSGRYCRINPPTDDQIKRLVALFKKLINEDVQLDDIRES